MITVVLVNWNGWADTIACLQSLMNSHPVPARAIVVDNRSSDGSLDNLRSWADGRLELMPHGGDIEQLALRGRERPRRVTFIEYDEVSRSFVGLEGRSESLAQGDFNVYVVRCSRNGGFGYGCNVGMNLGRLLGTDTFWLLNNDCVVPPSGLGSVNAQALQHPRAIFGTVLKYYHDPIRIQAMGGGRFCSLTGRVRTLRRAPADGRFDFINGASMVFSAGCLEDVGGFDEKIFMYFEENDFCMRAADKGYRFDLVPIDVYHKLGGSQGNRPSVKAWTQVMLNKHYVLQKNLGTGPWVFFYFAMLLARAVLPLPGSVERTAARQVLKSFITGSAAR